MKGRIVSLLAAAAVASSATISSIALAPAAVAVTSASVVPTFNSVGIYWAPTGMGSSAKATAQYRVAGSSTWKSAQDLWYDGRAVGGRPKEYRGSIVGLASGTTYEIKLTIAGTSTTVTQTVKTWSDKFPIAKTIELPATSSKPVEITQTGSPTGYVLVTGPNGGPATVDVANNFDYNLRISNSAYVIVRGLTLKGAKQHGIVLGAHSTDKVTDIVLEGNTVSGWGTRDSEKFGRNLDSAIFSSTDGLARTVVQGNVLKDPRTDSNSWKEYHGGYHPEGPQGITYKRGQGNHVIRYNDVTGNDTHRFNDGMGTTSNFSYAGFPGKDTDIYGNYVAYTWDDGIESEGSNMNVRIWDNYFNEVYHGLGLVPVAHGPLYAFRNVQDASRTGPGDAYDYGQAMFKMGGKTSGTTFYGDGRVYLFHNTVLKPTNAALQSRKPIEAGDGRVLRNAITRNNILQTGAASGTASISDKGLSPTNSFDYDIYNGSIISAPGAEPKGIKGVPTYVSNWGMDHTARAGQFALASSSLGFDKGVALANFNDGFAGAAPDMGAFEGGQPSKVYGVKAFRAAMTSTTTATTTGTTTATTTGTTTTPTVSTTGGTPDLTLSNITLNPVTPVPGSKVTFSATVRNIGTAPTPAGVVNGLRFAVNGTTVTYNYTFNTSIAPGQSVVVSATSGPLGVGTWTASSGGFKIQAKIDARTKIAELSETNNTSTRTIRIS